MFEGSSTHIKEEFDAFLERQNAATLERNQFLNETHEHFMKKLKADFEQHIVRLTEVNQKHNQFVIDKLTTRAKKSTRSNG